MRTLYSLLLFTLLLGGEISAQTSVVRQVSPDSTIDRAWNRVIDDPHLVVEVSRKIQIQALRRSDSLLYAKALNTEGKARFYTGQVNLAIASINQAYAIFEKYNNRQGLLKAYYQLGIIEAARGNDFVALLKFKKCLSLTPAQSQSLWRAHVLYQIARVNFNQTELDLAWSRTTEAEDLIQGLNATEFYSQLKSLQGRILLESGQLESAGDYLDRALTLAARTEDSLSFGIAYSGLGRLELQRHRYDRAKNYMERALRISQKAGSPESYTENLILISQLYLKTGKNNEALSLALDANTRASSLEEMPALERNALKNLANVYLAKGDTSKAYKYSHKVRLIDDSVLNDEVNKYVLLPGGDEKQESGDFPSGPSQNSGKSTGQLLTDDQVSMIIIGGLILLCAMLTIALIRKGHKPNEGSNNEPSPQTEKAEAKNESAETPTEVQPRENSGEALQTAVANLNEVEVKYQHELNDVKTQLEEQKQLAEEKQKELDSQNKHYEELDKNKNKVFSVLTHDLRQPINQIKSVLNLLQMEELDGDDRREIVEKLQESVDNSSNALENLLLWSKKQLTGISTKIVDVHLLPQVWQLESHLKPNLEAKEITLKINIPDFFKVKADMNQLDICLRNLLTNAIKFSNRGGTITIDAIEENGQKIVRVIDEGVGMTPEQLQKLKTLKENFSTKGTMNEKGTGLGIMITSEFMENQQGKLEIMSRKGEGSIFSMVFSAGSASRAEQPPASANS